MREGGGKGTKNYSRGVSVEGVAGQGGGGGMVQSSTPSHLNLNHSFHHTTRHCFFILRLGHAEPPGAASRSVNRLSAKTKERGRPWRLSTAYISQEENLEIFKLH